MHGQAQARAEVPPVADVPPSATGEAVRVGSADDAASNRSKADKDPAEWPAEP